MKRSSRSVPTGPGSRGGQWHDPEYRRAYYRKWRDDHPKYKAAEAERMKRKRRLLRRQRQEQRGGASLTEILAELVRAEVAAIGVRPFARTILLGHMTVYRHVLGTREMKGEAIDAYVAYFGLRAIAREYRVRNGRRKSV